MSTTVLPVLRDRRHRALPALAAPPLFLVTAGALTAADRASLASWGWTVSDHHGVPWPSSLALLPAGRLQTISFTGTGLSLISLATAVPRGGRAVCLAICGAGLAAAAFPLDAPVGDPASLGSWIRSWPAAVHVGGFAVAGVSGLLAIGASRRRADLGIATALGVAATLGGTPGWYAFLGGFCSWVTRLAKRTAGGPRDLAPSTG